MNETLQRLAIALTLGLALVAMGHNIDTWEFWAITALFIAYGWLKTAEGVEQGVAMGIEIYTKMTPEQRAEVNKLMEEEQ